MKEYKLNNDNCSYVIMEEFFNEVKRADDYKLAFTALKTDGLVCDFVFTVKTDIEGDYYVSYYSDSNGLEYVTFIDGFTEIVDLVDILNRKEDIEYFVCVREVK